MKNRYCKNILAFFLCLILFLTPGASLAHSGGTDANGGHHDYKNKSGLGSYHYHHGYGPHLHPNGVCPYSQASATTKTKSTTTTTKKSSTSKETYIAAQKKLQELGYYDGELDGSFGQKSKTALKEFQKDNGLEADGKLGPKSKKALGIE